MDLTLSLPFSLVNTKGATALLLGSGISSAASILTGWGITLDLAQKVAAMLGEKSGPDPAEWYQQKFGEEPDYAKLLEQLAPTPAERQRLLRGYFVPTDEDREQHLKEPTKAHHAIAELVSKGYIRVILTTNFDPLLELALEAAGVQPAVVSNVASISGMMPLQHEPVTIIKLHGHYLDTRLRNTPAELASYEPELDKLLDRVLDEYGLIICGWSGVWDVALRNALLRCPTRRFSTYWTVKGTLAEEAKPLAKQRAAKVIEIAGADVFFQGLAEQVAALEDLAQPLPATTAVALATLKRYLPVEAQRIRLHDLMTAEVEAVWGRISELIPTGQPTPENMKRVVGALDALMDRLVHLLAVGAYWSTEMQQSLWTNTVARLSKLPGERSSSWSVWGQYHDYPLLLSFYAVGLGATAAGNDDLLTDLLLTARLRDSGSYGNELQSPAKRMFESIDQEYFAPMWPTKHVLSVNDYLHQVLRPAFKELVPDDATYDDVFDRFEYLTTIAFRGALQGTGDSKAHYFRHGRYMVREGWSRKNAVVEQVKKEMALKGVMWPLLRRGLYDHSDTALEKDIVELDKLLEQARFWR